MKSHFPVLYVEKEVETHPRVEALSKRYLDRPKIMIERFTEIFNPKNQNFRLQKKNPSLILAKKYGRLVLPTPVGYGIGGDENFYFSHMYNCLFDCRYCFLQGMYNSAHFVLFANFEDFGEEIIRVARGRRAPYFFSGYDCDSLAMDHVTHFSTFILPLFAKLPHAFLELRTKSVNIRNILKFHPLHNVIVAYTLTPKSCSEELEHKAPPLAARMKSLKTLQEAGWPIGLRFDPVIGSENDYKELFQEVFDTLDRHKIHSATLGPFRLPKGMQKRMNKLYPEEPLFVLSNRFPNVVEACYRELQKYLPEQKIFVYN